MRALAGEAVESADPRAFVAAAIAGKTRGGFECAVPGGVRHRRSAGSARRALPIAKNCAQLAPRPDVGITSADYALADTGTLVMLASPQEARMISLLPPAHIAVVPRARILTGLDELFSLLPNPGRVDAARWC